MNGCVNLFVVCMVCMHGLNKKKMAWNSRTVGLGVKRTDFFFFFFLTPGHWYDVHAYG